MSAYIGLVTRRLQEGAKGRAIKVSDAHQDGAFTEKQVKNATQEKSVKFAKPPMPMARDGAFTWNGSKP